MVIVSFLMLYLHHNDGSTQKRESGSVMHKMLFPVSGWTPQQPFIRSNVVVPSLDAKGDRQQPANNTITSNAVMIVVCLILCYCNRKSLGLLLAKAVEAAKSPYDVGAINADNLTVGETGFEDIGCLVVGNTAVSGEDDLVVCHVEVGITGWQTLVVIEHHVGHRQFHDGGLLAICQTAFVQCL